MPIAPGFDPRWTDIPDYILGITRAIWEDRGIDTLTRYYAEDLVVRSPASVLVGNGGIIAATQATLAEFPDRELPGEDVIWCWADADRTAFLSSHRLICQATHTGPGAYGAPTGRRLTYRILADCYCAMDQVSDEWLVRDQAAIVRQMGADIVDWTRDLIAREGGPEACVRPFTPETDVPGPYAGRGDNNPWGMRLEDILTALFDAAFSIIPASYDPAAELNYPGHQLGHGHFEVDRFWMGLRAAFPSARAEVHHRIGREDEGMPPRAAMRWSLTGRHDGWGRFGAPTGAPVHVMGITQAEFGPRGLRREWTLIDETAIWKQILLHTGAV
ncbi:MAG: ester cyclase [Pseudomonadota bacterium]